MLALCVDASRAGLLSPLAQKPQRHKHVIRNGSRPTSSNAARDARRPLDDLGRCPSGNAGGSYAQKSLNLAPTENVLVDTFEKWPMSLVAQARLEFGMQAKPLIDAIEAGRFTSKLPN
jgi:hypothetical protein